jgi:hypothetical protein
LCNLIALKALKDKVAKMEALLEYYQAQFLLAQRRQFGVSSAPCGERSRQKPVDFGGKGAAPKRFVF